MDRRTERYFDAVRLRIYDGRQGKWFQKTFRPPFGNRVLTDFCVAHAPNWSRKLSVLVAGKWHYKSAVNSEIMSLEKEGEIDHAKRSASD